ncbi:MAG: YqgE/AlgH family protein [Candidatus Krumholzibacteriia bacterium]
MGFKIRAGCFLIANPTLRDPNFSRTVVLLCEHGEQGSMGLVVNRPTEHTLAEALTGMPPGASQRLYWGGPVQQRMVLALHRDMLDTPGSKEIVDGMALGSDSEKLIHVLETADDPSRRVRVFSGYAGWGAGQLEGEMREHSWLVCPGNAGLVFSREPQAVWAQALRSMGPRYSYLATIPPDPRVN